MLAADFILIFVNSDTIMKYILFKTGAYLIQGSIIMNCIIYKSFYTSKTNESYT